MVLNEIINQVEIHYFQLLTSIAIDHQIRFVADVVTNSVALKNPIADLDLLDNEARNESGIYREGGFKSMYLIFKSGFYALIFSSDTANAKKYKKWVSEQMLRIIQVRDLDSTKRLVTPNDVIRFNDNWNRLAKGYSFILNEHFIRLYGRFEKTTLVTQQSSYGKEAPPDSTVASTLIRIGRISTSHKPRKNVPASVGKWQIYNS